VTNIYHLKDGLGLLKEYGETSSFVSLFFLDLYRGSVQKLHTVEYLSNYIHVVINKADPMTFILTHRINNEEQSSRICKIVNDTIIFNNVVDIEFYPECFYGKYVYATEWTDEVRILELSNYF
jgi:hypothetical protein